MAATTPTPRKRAPRKATAAAAKKAVAAGLLPGGKPAVNDVEPPAPFTGLDLDALDKKSVLPDVTDVPFQFLLDGHVYTMLDPRDVDWKSVLDGISNPILFMRLGLDDPDEADRFISAKLPGWKLSALFDRWQSHYGVSGLTDLNKLLGGREQADDE